VPYARQARRNYDKSFKVSDQQVSHEEAEKVIKQRSLFLRKPNTIIEKRGSRLNENDKERKTENPDNSREPKFPRAQNSLADIVSFEVKDLDPNLPFFDVNLEGKKIVITYNGRHPFYQKFMLENRDNHAVINGIHYLVYSMATAEVMAYDEVEAKFLNKLRENYSFNLRQLLTT
jgi:hypothetical protein